MGWDMEEDDKPKAIKKEKSLSSKLLVAIIFCLIIIVILFILLKLNVTNNTYTFTVDGKSVGKHSSSFYTTIDGIKYFDIEEFAKFVGYEYHENEEFKSYIKQNDRAYVKGKYETATFYLNDNKVCKLPVDKMSDDYQEYITENTIKKLNNKIYASEETIELAFNCKVESGEKTLKIATLDYLVSNYDKKIKELGYESIVEQPFENKKLLLYNYIIVRKENGLYKIIDTKNVKEIVSDKYNSIEFIESTKEFQVTNNMKKVGIINFDGTSKIEPVYDSIKLLDKKSNLYLVEKSEKFGVVKSGDISVIYPEYDSIGLSDEFAQINGSQYIILDTLIPVCKDGKYGAFDKSGKKILNVEYDDIGCNVTSVEKDGIQTKVNAVVTIKECNGVVLKKNEKYGIMNIKR